MQRRLEICIPIVLIAVLAQLLAPIAAFRAFASAANDPLYGAAICSGMSPSPAPAADPARPPHHHDNCCGFCGAGHTGSMAAAAPSPVFTSLQRQYRRVSWLEAVYPMPAIRVGSNAQAPFPDLTGIHAIGSAGAAPPSAIQRAVQCGSVRIFPMFHIQHKSFRFSLVALTALAGAGLCVFGSPPRARAGINDDSFFTHVHTDRAMANVTIAPGHSGPVVITIQLETTDETPLTAQAVSVTLTPPQRGEAPLVATAQRTGDDQWQATMSVPSAGRWDMGLGIRLSESNVVNVVSPILIQ